MPDGLRLHFSVRCFQSGFTHLKQDANQFQPMNVDAESKNSPAIALREVSVATPQGKLLLDGVSITCDAGTTTVILGRSGSGKTTLLRTVNGMVAATSGRVMVNDVDVRTANLIALRRGIGYVIQETGLFPHFTIERNVGIVLEALNRPKGERIQRAHELLKAVGLEPASFAHRYPHQLSGGQRQRVGLARALAADPPILLMDEPFGALDPLTRAEMQDLLRSLLNRMRKTIVLVTHDVDEAIYLADRIVLLHDGRLAAQVTPREFLSSNAPEVAVFLRAYHRGADHLQPEDRE